MTVENDIITLLNTTGKKAYHLSLPDNPNDYELPVMVLQRISTTTDKTHGGNAFERARFQVTCWATTFSACRALALEVKNLMDLNQTNFELATKENEIDTKEVETNLYGTILDFFVWS